MKKMDLYPMYIFAQSEKNLDTHHPVIKLVASLAQNRGVTFGFFVTFGKTLSFDIDFITG